MDAITGIVKVLLELISDTVVNILLDQQFVESAPTHQINLAMISLLDVAAILLVMVGS